MVKQGKSVLQYILQNSSLLDEVCYIPSYKRYSTIDEDETIELASEAAAISKSDMIAFMQGFADAIEYFVCNGHSVKIDGVGTFSLSINANTYAVNAASIPSAVDSPQRQGCMTYIYEFNELLLLVSQKIFMRFLPRYEINFVSLRLKLKQVT